MKATTDVISALEALRNLWPIFTPNELGLTPFDNSGVEYHGDLFKVMAYSWDDDNPSQWNFKWRDFEVTWYKHLGRGDTMNRKISIDELRVMMQQCIGEIMTQKCIGEIMKGTDK